MADFLDPNTFRKPNYSSVLLSILKEELQLVPYEGTLKNCTFLLRTKEFNVKVKDVTIKVWYELYARESGYTCLDYITHGEDIIHLTTETLWDNQLTKITQEEAIEACFSSLLDHFYFNFIHSA